MKRTLDALTASGPTPEATRAALVALVAQLRPKRPSRLEEANSNLDSLIAVLRTHSEGRIALRDGILNLLGEGRLLPLLTESGIQSSAGFFSEAVQKLVHRVLPPLSDPSDIKDLVSIVFTKSWDFRWVEAVPAGLWMELIDTLFDGCEAQPLEAVRRRAWEALQVLSLRIAAVGLEPDVVSRLPELEHETSPVFSQQESTRRLIERLRAGEDPAAELSALDEALSRCDGVVTDLRERRSELGASLQLTGLLRRMSQLDTRLRLVATLVAQKRARQHEALVELLVAFVRAENQRHSLKEHIAGNVELLAYQVTEHTGRTGEHYITRTRAEWKAMFRSAVGGGLVVGFLAWFKLLMSALTLSLFGQAFFAGLNYAAGFVLVHLTHSTLATKQPAMIASKLAAAFDKRTGTPLEDLSGLIVKVARSQFVAFVGNVLTAFPVALLIGLIYRLVTGEAVASPEKAEGMLAELHPLESLSVLYASIAGLWLFLAGLISGYLDNLVVTSQIGPRLRAHRVLRRLLGEKRLDRLAHYLDGNLGPIGGNVVLGLLLGATGVVGFILGLPLDVRHITFVSGSSGLALSSLGFSVGWETLLWTALGIVLVGAMNFSVSFGLSLLVAIRSRGVSFGETPRLLGLLAKHFITRPSEFFVPPPDPAPEEEPGDEEGIAALDTRPPTLASPEEGAQK